MTDSTTGPATVLPPRIPATFTGAATTYYGIYITNVFLSIITLGIYSPWAKVRNRRFFYGHTQILGSAFDYDASPVAILVARVLLIGLFLALLLTEMAYDLTIGEYGFSFLVFVLLLPILNVRGRAFNFRHTIWRGVRFRYERLLGPSYAHLFAFTIPQLLTLALLGYSLTGVAEDSTRYLPELIDNELGYIVYTLLVIHLVLLFPVGHWWRHRIIISQLSFGSIDLRFTSTPGQYVRAYVEFVLLLAVFAGLALWWLLGRYQFDDDGAILIFLVIGFASAALFLFLVYLGRTTRLYWAGVESTDGSRVDATFNPVVYALWIHFVNLLLTYGTLGALAPFARVRRWRYLARRLAFLPSAELAATIAGNVDIENALGSEAIDMEGFDLDLGMI